MPNSAKILTEYRKGGRVIVLEKTSGYAEFGNYVILTSTRFFSETDAKAFYEAEISRRIRKGSKQ